MSPHCFVCKTPGISGDLYCADCGAAMIQPDCQCCMHCNRHLGTRTKYANYCPFCGKSQSIASPIGIQSTSEHPSY